MEEKKEEMEEYLEAEKPEEVFSESTPSNGAMMDSSADISHKEATEVYCEKCGAVLSADHVFCPKCGHKIGESNDPTENEQTEPAPSETGRKKKKTKWIVGLVLGIAAVAAIVIVFITISGNVLNEDEKYVCSVISRYKNVLKDPDSLIIRGDILYVEDLKSDKYIFFNASANNSYGAKVTSCPMYKGYSYLGDYSDDYEEMDDDKKLGFLYASRILAMWNFVMKVAGVPLTKEDGYNSVEEISGKKIAAKLRCEWRES